MTVTTAENRNNRKFIQLAQVNFLSFLKPQQSMLASVTRQTDEQCLADHRWWKGRGQVGKCRPEEAVEVYKERGLEKIIFFKGHWTQ